MDCQTVCCCCCCHTAVCHPQAVPSHLLKGLPVVDALGVQHSIEVHINQVVKVLQVGGGVLNRQGNGNRSIQPHRGCWGYVVGGGQTHVVGHGPVQSPAGHVCGD